MRFSVYNSVCDPSNVTYISNKAWCVFLNEWLHAISLYWWNTIELQPNIPCVFAIGLQFKCRSSAYTLIASIDSLYIFYVIGANRYGYRKIDNCSLNFIEIQSMINCTSYFRDIFQENISQILTQLRQRIWR